MDEKMDFEGLAKLIAACAKAKVNKLVCGTVVVEFRDGTMDWKDWPKTAKSPAPGAGGAKVEQEDGPDDSQLLLEDPLAYEKMQFEN